MNQIKVTLPDGLVREYPKGVSLAEIARDAGKPDALVAKVDGELRDLATKLDRDARVEPLTFEQPEGREVYWHSSAHLLAQAVKQLFPEAKLAIGPPIDDGFYYDIDLGRPFAPEHLEMLQRIYGISFPRQEQLDEFLRQLEEAKRRDHRRLGKDLKLFAFAEELGQGLPLWLPRGATVRRLLENYIVTLELQHGYLHVYAPDLASVQLYKISGHWDYFREAMYPPMKVDNDELVLKPMNCPHHIMIYKQDQRSYRDLPVRIAELGRMYRYEKSGTLTGLHRVRSMTLNDAHIFCRQDQVKEEFAAVVRLIQQVYQDFRITDYRLDLSLHDPKDRQYYHQDEELWMTAEGLLHEVLRELGLTYTAVVGGANFYGPKLDVQVRTATGKEETLSTVQLDFLLPKRFELEFIGEDGKSHRPVMIHRAIISTMERMMAFLIEYYAGDFPVWLAPEQVRVLPIADRHLDYARNVRDRLTAAAVRVELDTSNERISYKVRRAQVDHVPYMLVVGDKEASSGQVAVRSRGAGDLGPIPLETFAARIMEEVAAKQ